MTQNLRLAHLVVGGVAVVAFLITGQIMGRHEFALFGGVLLYTLVNLRRPKGSTA